MAPAALLIVLVGAIPVHASCDPGTDPDRSDIANARAAVAANCDCAGAPTHGTYVSCAVQHANAVLTNKDCARFVKQCASRSTCGKPTAVTCCLTMTNGTRCRIQRDAAHCAAKHATVGSCTSCCDACPTPGSGPSCPTTTTTTTVGATTTTLARIPCAGGTTPQCTDGSCGGSQQCGGNQELVPGLSEECDCFPPGVTPCGPSGFPQCDGACLEGKVCGKFQQFDASSGQWMKLCACVDPTAACEAPSPGSCTPGYCGTQLACSFVPVQPGGPLCGCGEPQP